LRKLDLTKFTGFIWDQGNFLKSELKHNVTSEEAEQIFIDPELFYQEDFKHSETEKRFIAIGKIESGKVLFAVFTPRHDKIRIISTRTANRKEIKTYDEA